MGTENGSETLQLHDVSSGAAAFDELVPNQQATTKDDTEQDKVGGAVMPEQAPDHDQGIPLEAMGVNLISIAEDSSKM